ncbi:MAG TPA: HAD-IA family hydrolase, partial [Polyangia bacterium]
MLKYELVCFDLDGTLVDSTSDIQAALVHALAAVPPTDARLDERALGSAGLGLPLDEFYALARPAPHPLAGEEGQRRFVDAYRSYYHAHLLDQTRAFPGVAETLELVKPLRAAGLRTAVATTKKTITAERVLEGLGLAHHFDLILGTEEPMPHKPAPDLLLECARRLARDPTRGLMVGDTERDVLAGRAAAMRTCGVTYGVLGAEGLTPHAPD